MSLSLLSLCWHGVDVAVGLLGAVCVYCHLCRTGSEAAPRSLPRVCELLPRDVSMHDSSGWTQNHGKGLRNLSQF